MIKTLLSVASPGNTHGRLSVFIFHRVLSQPDELFPDEPDIARFTQMMAWIKQWFNVIPLDTAIRRLKSNTLPARAASITFDDGYADNYQNALPILKQHGLTATFFIATGFLDGGRMWNDSVIETLRAHQADSIDLGHLGLAILPLGTMEEKRSSIAKLLSTLKYLPVREREIVANQIVEATGSIVPNDLMMTSTQVVAMRSAGMQIGAHTVSHPILARTTTAEARKEIGDSKHQLEQLLGEDIALFAYPNGKLGVDYLSEHATLVQELGFEAAVATDWGASSRETNLFNIPRFTPWDKSKTRFGLRTAWNLWANKQRK